MTSTDPLLPKTTYVVPEKYSTYALLFKGFMGITVEGRNKYTADIATQLE